MGFNDIDRLIGIYIKHAHRNPDGLDGIGGLGDIGGIGCLGALHSIGDIEDIESWGVIRL